MRKIVCDVCGKDTREGDVRYVGIYREKVDEVTSQIKEVPCAPTVECCVICAEKVKSFVGSLIDGGRK